MPPRTPESHERPNGTSRETSVSEPERRIKSVAVNKNVDVDLKKYREAIRPFSPMDIDGYGSKEGWNPDRLFAYNNYIFIAKADGSQIAGFQIDEADNLRQVQLSKFPVILTVLREKFAIPTPSPQNRARRAEFSAERREREVNGSIESVHAALQDISIEAQGQKLPIDWLSLRALSHFVATRNISPQRFAHYVKNMRDHAAILSNALENSSWRGRVRFNGECFVANNGQKTLTTTATMVLVTDGNRRGPKTLDGRGVSEQKKPTSTEYRIGGRREIHRNDGGLMAIEQGNRLQFFDGDNRRPVLEQVNKEKFIVGPSGERVGMRPRGSNGLEWGRSIARSLRTPEAIGAFVSQFYYGPDYKRDGTPENTAWLSDVKDSSNPAQWVADPENRQIVQRWDKTLERRAGDCEDFALLAQGLLEQVGIQSFTVMVTKSHYETAFFERAANGGYHVCTVGLGGFKRSTETFPTTGEAVATLWNGKQVSSAQFALTQPGVRETFGDYPAHVPGAYILYQPDSRGAISDMKEYRDKEFFESYVRE